MLVDFYKRKPSDKIWWTKDIDIKGRMYFSFDKKTLFNVFSDYPEKLIPEQKEISDKENPYCAILRGNIEKHTKENTH
ncbi:MAG: hypothetical protein IJ619_08755 [Eubacterium sp.]|nr:hypothetical protein [Eubacterium sp.]